MMTQSSFCYLRSVFCMREYTQTLEYRVAQSEFRNILRFRKPTGPGGGGGVKVRPQLTGGGANSSCKCLILYYSHFSLRASCFVEFRDVGLRMRACARVYNK